MAQFSSYPRVPGGSTGQKTMAQSAPVVIASDQSPVNVNAGQLPNSLGAKTIANSVAVNVASDQVVPVSATALPLPAGAATSANQSSAITALTAIQTDSDSIVTNTASTATNTADISSTLNDVLLDTDQISTNTTGLNSTVASPGSASAKAISVQGVAGATAIPVSGTFYQATQPVSGTVTVTQPTGSSLHTVVDSSALPTGAATSAIQTTISGQLPASLGTQLIAASLAVNIASDQVVPVSFSGGINAVDLGFSSANAPVRIDYTSTPVTTAAYTTLVAALASTCQEVEIFDSSGQTLTLAVGGAGSEVNQMNVFPGGNGRVKLKIPSGSRISIKALSANASVGEIDINFYG